MESTPTNTSPEDSLPQELRAAYSRPFTYEQPLTTEETQHAVYKQETDIHGPQWSETTGQFTTRSLAYALRPPEKIRWRNPEDVFNPLATPEVVSQEAVARASGSLALAGEVQPPRQAKDELALAA